MNRELRQVCRVGMVSAVTRFGAAAWRWLAGCLLVACFQQVHGSEAVAEAMKPAPSPVIDTVDVVSSETSAVAFGEQARPAHADAGALLESAVATLMNDGLLEASPFRAGIETAAARFYRQRDYREAWAGADRIRQIELPRLRETLGRLLQEHALAVAELQASSPKRGIPAECPVSREDLVVTLTLLDAAVRVRFGPPELALLWENYRSAEEEVDAWFAAAVDRMLESSIDPGDFLDAVAPGNPVYRRLVAFYRGQREPLERGAVAFEPLELPGGVSAVRPGDVYPGAGRLAAMLAAEGLLPEASEDGGETGGIFTPELSVALKNFQASNSLNPDGVLGSRSLAALNLGPEEKLRRLAVNLQRARQLPDDCGARAVFANIPGGEVEAYEGGELKEKMRIVFGQNRSGRRTPIFHDIMQYVVFRPYWRVPPGIVTNEIAPETRDDPMSFYRKGYEIVDGFGDSSALSPTWENLAAAAAGRLRIRQKPGRGNALGLVKFLFPNPHSVYMHDTPQVHLFAKDRRDFSHGCIRLHHPEKMALYVLGGQGWDEGRIKAAMEGKARRSVSIEAPVRVFIVYFTAWPDPEVEGKICWTPDIYGRDEAVWHAIAAPVGTAGTVAARN